MQQSTSPQQPTLHFPHLESSTDTDEVGDRFHSPPGTMGGERDNPDGNDSSSSHPEEECMERIPSGSTGMHCDSQETTPLHEANPAVGNSVQTGVWNEAPEVDSQPSNSCQLMRNVSFTMSCISLFIALSAFILVFISILGDLRSGAAAGGSPTQEKPTNTSLSPEQMEHMIYQLKSNYSDLLERIVTIEQLRCACGSQDSDAVVFRMTQNAEQIKELTQDLASQNLQIVSIQQRAEDTEEVVSTLSEDVDALKNKTTDTDTAVQQLEDKLGNMSQAFLVKDNFQGQELYGLQQYVANQSVLITDMEEMIVVIDAEFEDQQMTMNTLSHDINTINGILNMITDTSGAENLSSWTYVTSLKYFAVVFVVYMFTV